MRPAIADTLSETAIGYPHSPRNGPRSAGPGWQWSGGAYAASCGTEPVGAGGAARFALFAAPDQATKRLLRDYQDLREPSVRSPPSRPRHVAFPSRWLYGVRGEE